MRADLEPDLRSIAQRKAHRQRVAPKRFQDAAPEPQPVLLPTIPCTPAPPVPVVCQTKTFSGVKTVPPIIFQTPWNLFGLSKKYTTSEVPSHDPDDHPLALDLVDDTLCQKDLGSSSVEVTTSCYPYPNKNSSLLGIWYWLDGLQKSHVDFRNLIDIVGSPDFKPEDVRDTKWGQIDVTLGGSDFDGDEWEDADAGWMKSPVTISVPIPRRSRKDAPDDVGPQDYTFGNFYHRSIVSIIREKITNPSHSQQFHYSPFELLWRASPARKATRVHGEMYHSSEFIRVHNELQESPAEPGCQLSRVVVALMCWSDSTHLTSFGNASLWPLYLGFGNESKYRRCRPSLSLLNHLAYFEKVALVYF